MTIASYLDLYYKRFCLKKQGIFSARACAASFSGAGLRRAANGP